VGGRAAADRAAEVCGRLKRERLVCVQSREGRESEGVKISSLVSKGGGRSDVSFGRDRGRPVLVLPREGNRFGLSLAKRGGLAERLCAWRIRSWLRGEGRGSRGWRGAATVLFQKR
jgi:hypothetical protein